MQKVSRPIDAEFVELLCDNCKTGVLRIQPEQCEAHWTSSIDIHCAPNTWELECHQCRRHVSFAIPGPYLVYKSREFILFDSALAKINALRALLRRSTTQK